MPPGRLVDIGGQMLHLNCTGRGSPTVLLESGTGDLSVIWSLVQPGVATFARVCSYDRGGYAWSEPGVRPRSFAQLALEFRTALDRSGERPPYVLVGQSYGGLAARGFAARYAADVVGMVLVDAAHEDQRSVYGGRPHKLQENAKGRAFVAPRVALDTALVREARARPMRHMDSTLPAPLDRLPRAARDIWRWAETQPMLGLARDAEQDWSAEEMVRMHDERLQGRASLGDIPLRVLSRERGGYADGMNISADSLERERRALQRDLGRLSSRGVVTFVNSGHNIHVEQPAVVVRAIRDVVADARQTSSRVPRYWGSLVPGAHAIGFSQHWIVDSSRRLPNGAQYGLRFRPILVNLWYPAVAAKSPAMRYGDVFAGAVRVAGRNRALASYASALIAYERRTAWRELASADRDSTAPDLRRRIDDLLSTATLAARDAPRAKGSFPLVIYTQGSQSSMDDNIVLCEYLASRGYIVVGSAYPQEANESFATSASDESRQRDIRRLVVDVGRLFGRAPTSVTVVGHSAGAQAMHLLAADPSAPIDAVLSLDTTEDYAMLSDNAWAYFTDRAIERRKETNLQTMFVADPSALFELADSLVASPRWLVTVPNLSHNDFISQGIIRKQLLAGLTGDDTTRRRAAPASYRALVEYIAAWLDANENRAGVGAAAPVGVVYVPRGESFPAVVPEIPRSGRELRHLFSTAEPASFADRAIQARRTGGDVADNGMLMMLLVDAVRRGATDRARDVYTELVRRDSTVRGVRARIEDRAKLFERIGAKTEADGWRQLLRAFEP